MISLLVFLVLATLAVAALARALDRLALAPWKIAAVAVAGIVLVLAVIIG